MALVKDKSKTSAYSKRPPHRKGSWRDYPSDYQEWKIAIMANNVQRADEFDRKFRTRLGIPPKGEC